MFSSSLIPPTPLHPSTIHTATMDVSDTNMIISTSLPVYTVAVAAMPAAEDDEQLVLIENVVDDTSPRRRRGKGDILAMLPPLPLEKELFIPPVEKGNRAERSILVLTETFLGMMSETGKEEVKIKETASTMKTSIKRVYTICNVLEAMRLMVRMDRNVYEWQGRRMLMPTMVVLRQMAEKQNMMLVELDKASTWAQGQDMEQQVEEEDVPNSLPVKKTQLNICMMTQKLVMMFLVIPQPKVLSLSVASSIIHGVGLSANKRRGSLQKLCDIGKILQGLGMLRKVKVTVGRDKGVLAYQYVGQEVELMPLPLVEENESMSVGLESIGLDKEGAERMGMDSISTEVREDEILGAGGKGGDGRVPDEREVQLQSNLVVMEGKKVVRLQFVGDEVEMMRDCKRKKK